MFAEQNDGKEYGQGMTLEILSQEQLQQRFQTLFPQFLEVTCNATGRTLDEMREEQREVMSGWDFALAFRDKEKMLGYGGFELPEFSGIGQALDISALMIRKDQQGKHLSERFIGIAAQQNPDARFYHFTTQNPAAFLAIRRGLQNVGIETKFAPIDCEYQEEIELFNILQKIRFEKQTKGQRVHSRTGLRSGVYGKRLGDYEIRSGNPDIQRVDARMLLTGLNRQAGDGLLVIGKRI